MKEIDGLIKFFRGSRAFAAIAGILLALAVGLGSGAQARSSNYTLPEPPPAKPSDQAMTSLHQLSLGVSEIADSASKAVVLVSTTRTVQGQPLEQIDPFEFFFGGPRGRRFNGPSRQAPESKVEGIGSGFIIDLANNYIITNNHVVEGAQDIQIKLPNGQVVAGKVVGRDKRTDIAVVRPSKGLGDRKGLGQLYLGDSDNVHLGNVVVALGAPFGLELSASLGIVSATGRGNLGIAQMGNFIQTDAAINPGNSGGPLLDADGRVIGMNTAIYSETGAYNGIGFAVPSNIIRRVTQELINQGKVERGYLGVQLQPLDNEIAQQLNLPAQVTGGLVAHVETGSPAAKAGLVAGDVITGVNNLTVKDSNQLVSMIGLMRPGSTANLTIYRDGKQRQVQVKLGQYPASHNAAPREPSGQGNHHGANTDTRFGLALETLTPQLAQQYHLQSKHGAVIAAIAPDSPAQRAGLHEGDAVLRVNGHQVTSAKDFWNVTRGKDRLIVQVERQGQYIFVPLNAGEQRRGGQG